MVYCSTNSDKYNIENFAFKDKTFDFHVPTLQSQSISVLTSDSEFNDSDSSDDSDDEEVSFESSASENDEKENYELEAVEVNYVVVLEILKESSWNWFSFVILLEEHLKNKGYSLAVFDQVLMDFAAQLPNLCLSDEEMRLTEQSRISYLETLRQKDIEQQRCLRKRFCSLLRRWPDSLPKDTLPKDILPRDILPNGHFADGRFAERTFCRTDVLPNGHFAENRDIF